MSFLTSQKLNKFLQNRISEGVIETGIRKEDDREHEPEIIRSKYLVPVSTSTYQEDIIGDINIDADYYNEAVISVLIETINDLNTWIIENDADEHFFAESAGVSLGKGKQNLAKRVVGFTEAQRRMSNNINIKFNKIVNDLRNSQKTNSYDSIVRNTVNLSRLLKGLFGSALLSLLIPGGLPVKLMSTAIFMIAKVALDRRTDDKYKQIIFNDLRFELKISQEKVRDAESRGDIKAKYRLLRIQNDLERTIDRMKFGFKS